MLPSAAPMPPCPATVWLRVGHPLETQAVGSPAPALPGGARQQAERMGGVLAESADGLKGQIRLQATANGLPEFLAEPLSRFLATHPSVSIDLEERLSDEIVAAVADGAADIGIVAGTVGPDGSVHAAGLEVFPFRDDRFVLVVAADHALAAHAHVGFADLLEHDFVGLDRASA